MAVTSLVTLADVKAQLNIPSTDTSNDAELQGFIDGATSLVTYIIGPQVSQTFTETRDGGGPVIMLDNPPILSITSVTEYYVPNGMRLTLQPLGQSTDAYGYTFEGASGKLVRRTAGGFESPFIGGKDSVVIVYTAGVNAVDPMTRLAVLMDIQGLWRQTQQAGTFGGGAIGGDETWTTTPMNLFPRLASLLDAARRTQSIG